MSASTVEIIMWRIQSATKESPIAVFRLPDKCGRLNAVFASTAVTHGKILNGDKDLIGVYSSDDDPVKTRLKLQREAR